jgi:hypothetical protein
MPRQSSLNRAKDLILAHFRDAGPQVYAEPQLEELLQEKREAWGLAQRVGACELIKLLEREIGLELNTFNSADYRRKFQRYVYGPLSPLSIAQSYNNRAYLCYGTAAAVHGIMNHDPKAIYLNVEQSPKTAKEGIIAQERLDLAFSRNQRLSNLRYALNNTDIILTIISGKNTKSLGVEKVATTTSEILKITNLPRTLIDITVRPAYAGGPMEVLEAYRVAKKNVSAYDLVGVLTHLGYKYPYHQAIGFLMQRAGFPEKEYSQLKKLGMSLDFYLAHGMTNPNYSSEWRLFIPQEL